jgi:uncharacterized protein
MKILIFAFVILGFAHSADAASFNCRKASTNEEILICADELLSNLDAQMGEAYQRYRNKSSDRKQVLNDQRRWLDQRRECLQRHNSSYDQIECMRDSTIERIAELSGNRKSDSVDTTFAPAEDKATMSNSVIGQRIIGRCHMDGCSWFQIDNRSIEGRSANGILYRIQGHEWSSVHPNGSYEIPAPLTDEGNSEWYAFCSLTNPSVVFKDGQGWRGITISPSSPGVIYGYNESTYVRYYAACHDLEFDGSEEKNIRMGLTYGYIGNPNFSEKEILLNSPLLLLR